MNKEGQSIGLLTIILIFAFVVLASFAIRSGIFFLMALVFLALIIGGVFYLIRQYMLRGKGVSFDTKVVGKIHQSIKACDDQIRKNINEIEEIKEDIDDLDSHLIPGHDINEKSREESQRLIRAFEKQIDLRKTKLAFYETCKKKLETILYNHKLAIALEKKQNRLNELEESQYESLAQMETLKTELEYDKSYISTIEQLSLKMLRSNSIGDAEALNLELVQITKELRRL